MKKVQLAVFALVMVFVLSGCCLLHEWNAAACELPETCAKCGKTRGEALGHTWAEADCETPKTCSVCGATEGEALGHSAVPATQTEDSVCTRCGELLERATGVWERIHFLDQFGDPTEEWYLHSQVEGKCTGNTADEEPTQVEAVIYKDSVQFRFAVQKQAEDCTVSTKDSEGEVTQYAAHPGAQADWICIEGADALDLMRQIHQNAVLKIAVAGSANRYNFSLNGKDDAAGAEEFLNRVYTMAEEALNAMDFDKAESLFSDLGKFRDALQRIDDVEAARRAGKRVVSTATIGATGDLLMHMPVIRSAFQANGRYNFEDIFRYLSSYSQSVDYAVANLETTLCGADNGYPYAGYPVFNCPDEIVDAVKNAGFDMLLTANNHSYDTGETGFYRTIETIRSRGLDNLGTMLSGDEPKYQIVDLNGIKVGMLCYTYSDPAPAAPNRVSLNYQLMHEGAEEEINTFDLNNTDVFYAEVTNYLKQMRDDGAEATIIFLHWGMEYTLQPAFSQTEMAQKLCDMGFDVIIGSHPHMVQPVELLSSSVDPSHRTVCLYSMGNALSNQRSDLMTTYPSGHTEDGVWFTVEFSKCADGTVFLNNVDLIPCWVDLGNEHQYRILPLDAAAMSSWKTDLALSDDSFFAAKKSYNRTMNTVGEGLTEAGQYFENQRQLREAEGAASAD